MRERKIESVSADALILNAVALDANCQFLLKSIELKISTVFFLHIHFCSHMDLKLDTSCAAFLNINQMQWMLLIFTWVCS